MCRLSCVQYAGCTLLSPRAVAGHTAPGDPLVDALISLGDTLIGKSFPLSVLPFPYLLREDQLLICGLNTVPKCWGIWTISRRWKDQMGASSRSPALASAAPLPYLSGVWLEKQASATEAGLKAIALHGV